MALRASISSSWVVTVMRLVSVILLASVIKAKKCDIESKLVQIFQNNGWNYVMVVHIGQTTKVSQCFVQEFMTRQVYVSSVTATKLAITPDSTYRYIFLVNDLFYYKSYEALIASTKPQKSAVILNIPPDHENVLLSQIEVQDLYFYLCSYSVNPRIRSVISTPRFTYPVITEVPLSSELKFLETYDFQGQTLYDVSVSYYPYNVEVEDDKARGLFPDLIRSLGSKFNFSLFHMFVRDWGVVPIQGTLENGTFGGAMGAVINGAFDMSLSSWLAVHERGHLLDTEPVSMVRNVLVMVPKPLKIDLKFFQHPFSIEAWQGILLMAFLICVTIIPPSLIVRNYENTDAYNWASLSAWSFFLLIDSFYGGALTMFFTTEADPPFSTFHEVVQAYPSWILKTLEGTDVYFHERAQSGDPDFKIFYERMIMNPEETTYSNTANVLRDMEDQYVVILGNLGVIQSAFQTNLDLKVPIEILGTMREYWTNVILKKHSPLSPMIRKGMNSLRDHAMMEKTKAKWLGQGIPKSAEISAYTLGLGQTLLVYFIIVVACIVSLIVLGLEHFYVKYYACP